MKKQEITLEYLLSKGHSMVVFEPRYSSAKVAVLIGGEIDWVASMADDMTGGGDSINHIETRVLGRYYPFGQADTFEEALKIALDKIRSVHPSNLSAVLRDVFNTRYDSKEYSYLKEIPNYDQPPPMKLLREKYEDGSYKVLLAAAYSELDGPAIRQKGQAVFRHTVESLELIMNELKPRAERGVLRAEYNGPDISQISDGEAAALRLATTDHEKVCLSIKDLELTPSVLTTRNHDGGKIMEHVHVLTAKVRPVGPYGDTAREALERAMKGENPNLRFGMRALCENDDGDRRLVKILSFDLINVP